MGAKIFLEQNSIFAWVLWLMLFLGSFFVAFCLGLIGLSFLDDLIQYQSNNSDKINLLIGLGTGTVCGVASIGALTWFRRGCH